MEETKSVIYTKAVNEAGFMLSLTARADSLEDAYKDIEYTISEYELKPWLETSNLLDRPAPVNQNMVDDAKELGAIRKLGVKTLPPTKDQCQIGDSYEVGVSMYSWDGEYLKFWKKMRDGSTNRYGIGTIKIGTPSWEEFEQVFPDWESFELGDKYPLPDGPQYLYYEVSSRLNGEGNPYHDLKGTRPA